MKNSVYVFLAFTVFSGCFLVKKQTKKHSPGASAAFNNNQLNLSLKYCSPSKKGRVIFGDDTSKALQPYGKYWRMGANEATWIEFNTDILFGGKEVKAGKYSLYAYPGIQEWQVVLGSKWDTWGFAEPDAKNEVLRIKVPAFNNAPLQEILLIKFDENATLVIHWDTVELRIPIEKK